jgi:hypothetical protein
MIAADPAALVEQEAAMLDDVNMELTQLALEAADREGSENESDDLCEQI